MTSKNSLLGLRREAVDLVGDLADERAGSGVLSFFATASRISSRVRFSISGSSRSIFWRSPASVT